MDKIEKQLLLKDLCTRLPYDTWVQYEGKEWLVTGYGHGRVSLLPSIFSSVCGPCPLIEEVKPYLRPMSSMTEEELDECVKYSGIRELECPQIETFEDRLLWAIKIFSTDYKSVDWLNAHYFDYRGLIEKGLALEAKEGMYND